MTDAQPESDAKTPATDQASELDRLRTENERMRHELEVMYGGAFDSLPAPAPEPGLREQIRRACAEADGFRFESLEPHDYQRHVDAVLAVLAVRDAELAKLRDDAAHLVAATGAQALKDRDRAEFYEAALARMRDRAEVAAVHAERANAQLLALLGEAVDWIHEGELRERICAALDGREVVDPEHAALKRAHVALAEQAGKDQAAIARVHAYLISLCAEPHPSHGHLCPDDVRRDVLTELDQPPTA